MGVGKYNLPYVAGPQAPEPDYTTPTFRYTTPGTIPAGVSANPFDQSAVNWQMAQKYAAERAQQNQDIWRLFQQGYNNWTANGQRGPAPNNPALFETDPNLLYEYFNSGQPGVLLQGNRVVDNRDSMGTVDPLAFMFQQGTATAKPLPPSALVPAPAPAPAAAPAAVPNTGLNNFGQNLTPEQRATAANTGPQPSAAAPPGSSAPANSQPAVTLPAVDAPVAQYPAPPAAPFQPAVRSPADAPRPVQAPSPAPNPAAAVNQGGSPASPGAGLPPAYFRSARDYYNNRYYNQPQRRFSNNPTGYAAPGATAERVYRTQPTGGTEQVSPYVAENAGGAQDAAAPRQQFSMKNRGFSPDAWSRRKY